MKNYEDGYRVRTAVSLLDRLPLDRPVRLVGVRFSNLVKLVEGTARSVAGQVD